jgi:hypothetical protein
MNAERAHHLEETAVSLCLLEAHVTVAVAILQRLLEYEMTLFCTQGKAEVVCISSVLFAFLLLFHQRCIGLQIG